MGQGLQILDIILFAAIAAFLILRLRSVLGRRTGHEGGNRQDPLANPLHADFRGFPPIYIQTGADEALLDDSRRLADLARKSGVDVTLEIVPEMQHVFQALAGTAPEADAAIRRLADWVRPKLGLG